MPVNEQLMKATADSLIQVRLNEQIAKFNVDSIVNAATSALNCGGGNHSLGFWSSATIISLAGIMVPISFIIGTAIIIYVYLKYRNRERTEMIKMGMYPDSNKAANPLPSIGNKSLFAGLIFLFIGAGAFIHSLITGSILHNSHSTSLICIGIGAACLIFWKLTEKQRKLAEEYYRTMIDKKNHTTAETEKSADELS